MHNLFNAVENLKHRVKSLNYSGYFTQTVYDVLKNEKVLNLQLALRIHGYAHNLTFHYYGNIQNEEKANRLKDALEEECEDYQRLAVKIKIDGSLPLEKLLKNNENLKPKIEKAGTIYYVDIPLWTIKRKETANEFYFKDDPSRKLPCLVLRGIIRLYSGHEKKYLQKCFDEKLWSGKSIFEEVQELFPTQEEPDCFQSSMSSGCKDFKYCSYRSSCFLNHTPEPIALNKTNHLNINPANPDEVIYQLQEKVRALLGASYKVAVLLLDPDIRYKGKKTGLKKLLKYRAVNYLEMKSGINNYLSSVKRNINQLNDERAISLINKANMFDDSFNDYYLKKYGQKQTVALAEQVTKLLYNPLSESQKNVAHNILRNIVQTTTDGITRIVWEQWVGYSNIIKLNDQYFINKLQPGSYYMDTIRSFAEGLFFSGDAVIITPLGYYGQKMGIIFTYYANEQSDKKEKDRLLEIEGIFSQLALELAPDLFYSLEYEMYNKALNALEDKTINDVPDILLSVFPQFLNIEAGAFWTKDQIKQIKNQENKKQNKIRPSFCRKFVQSSWSERILTFNTCEKCNEFCQFKQIYINEYYKNFEDPEFDPKPIVLSVDKDNYCETHKIKCRLLVPVKHEVSDKGETDIEKQVLTSMDGVFDLCFDLSEHVIRRFAVDLFREINFVYILVTNAAKQKYHIMRHATTAAVSAIIGRNHSHHIGSHVMPRATVGAIQERLELLYPTLKNNQNFISDNIKILKTKLDEYIQKKADFTAEISTQPLTTTKALRFIDHIIIGFLSNTLLMDNIGKNEGVCYDKSGDRRNKLQFRIIIKGDVAKINFSCGRKTSKCGSCELQSYGLENIPYASKCQQGHDFSKNDDIESDVEVALPGPLGEYAFYCFLENYIRNVIKHNRKTSIKDEKYTINIELEDEDDNYYRIRIYDDHTINSKEDFFLPDPLDPEKQIPCDLVTYLNYIKKKDIINADGTTRPEAWGVAEMLIMATLLKGSDNFMSMSDNMRVEVKDGYLSYSFQLMKVKKIAIIDGKETKTIPDDKKAGIWNFSSFRDYENTIRNSSPAAFEFMLILNAKFDDEMINNIKEIKSMMPCRIMLNESLYRSKEFDYLKHGTYELNKSDITLLKTDTYNSVWRVWLKKFLAKKSIGESCLVVSFDQQKTDSVSKSWFAQTGKTDDLYNLITVDKGKEYLKNNEDKISKSKNLIIYDRHGAAYLDMRKYKKTIFYEMYDKNSYDFVSIFRRYYPQTAHEMVEAALLKILILDERLTEAAYKSIVKGESEIAPYIDDSEFFTNSTWASRLNIARHSGVYLGTHIINNNCIEALHKTSEGCYPQIHASFSSGEKRKLKRVSIKLVLGPETNKSIPITDIDALIIHQGVLENFFDQYKTKDDYEIFLSSLTTDIPYIFVDSGRGIPPKLPDHVKFIPFSLLEEFLMKIRVSKYSLSKLMMNLYRR